MQAYLADDDKWIDNQLMNSGVVRASRAADAEVRSLLTLLVQKYKY